MISPHKYHLLLAILFPMLLISCNKGHSTDGSNSAEKNNKVNILYIMADDLAFQAISAYGGIYKDLAPTPNMDRLAAQGMLFTDVLCTNAICGPSRASILTGDYSHINGYYKNESGGKFDASNWTFPQEFQKNGYQTGLFGKWHLGTEPQGFDAFTYHNNASQQGSYWDPLYNINGTDSVVTGYATNITTDFALDWLENGRKADDPFLMLLQYKAPHRPWDPDKKYIDLWENQEMPYPENFNDDYEGREKTAGDTWMTMDYLDRRDMKMETPDELTGRARRQWGLYGVKPGELVQPDGMSDAEGKKWRYQKYIKDYLACVKSVDDNIGRVLDYLDANGLSESTMVVLTSDQGFYLGEHGFFDKRLIYEESLRMPFIVRYPAKVKAGSINEDIIANVDFASTFLDIADITSDHTTQGSSFAALLKGERLPDRDERMYYHYYEYPYWHHIQPHYGIRTQEYTLAHFYYNIDVWELYDLKKDPMEMHNVIDNPEYKEVVNTLKNELVDLRKKYKDDGSLEDFREITDKDFGLISGTSNEVQEFMTKEN